MNAATQAVRTILTATHGRYIVRGCGKAPAGLLVGFHGYAQDAESFLTDVESIGGLDDWIVVSVQGLHRFYTRAGQVVASWMTSQDRELAIADNIAFVRAVVAQVQADIGVDVGGSRGIPLVFAGFSQGVAMAFRAAAHIAGTAGIVVLGGDIPPEIRSDATTLPPVLLGRGHDDKWYSVDTLTTDAAWLKASEVEATIVEFEGGHEWTDAFRAEAATFLARIASQRIEPTVG